MSGESPERRSRKNPPRTRRPNLLWLYLGIGAGLLMLQFFFLPSGGREISWNLFIDSLLYSGDIARLVVVNQEYVEVYLRESALQKPQHQPVARTWMGTPNPGPHYTVNIGSVEYLEKQLEEVRQHFREQGLPFFEIVYEKRENWWRDLLLWGIPILLLILFWIFLMRRLSGPSPGDTIFRFGRAQPRIIEGEERVSVTFDDVAGLEEAKEEVREIVDFLRHPEKYRALGGKIPKGVLLVGPPGTGKTLLAKAIAGEANVPFFSVSGSEFVEMFVGVGASRVRDLFQKARQKAPCIIFIDEIDAIGRSRGKYLLHSGNDERESTLNQLLVEMDGFDSKLGIIVLAATNRPDVLDPALLRPGRFDRKIVLDRPDVRGREEIFRIHMRPLKVAPDVNPRRLAELTPGFVGADIANVCNEAALIAARRNKKQIDMEDFLSAIDKVIGGLERRRVISPEEKRRVAYHEAGHTVVAWFLPHTDPPYKVTIVPRTMGSLGFTQFLPRELHLYTESHLKESLVAMLGGRAAEELIFGEVSTGAQNDLERATSLAYQMVARFGMGEKVGLLSYPERDMEAFLTRPFSEDTARKIDEEVRKLLDEQYQRALTLLQEHREVLARLAEELLQKETVVYEDLLRIFGCPPASKKDSVTPSSPAESPDDGQPENFPETSPEEPESAPANSEPAHSPPFSSPSRSSL